MIGVDLVKNPDLANDPAIAQKIAAAYFAEKQKKGVDLGNISSIGKAVGYAGGVTETARRAQMAAGFQRQMASSTPSGATVQSSVSKESAPVTTASTVAPVTTSASSTPRTQESAESLLVSLNNSMSELLRVTKSNTRILERQLTGVQSLSSGTDLWSSSVV